MISSIFWSVFYVVWGRTVNRPRRLVDSANQLRPDDFCFAHVLSGAGYVATRRRYICTGITIAGVDLGWMNAIMQFAHKEEISHYTALHTFLVGVHSTRHCSRGHGIDRAPGHRFGAAYFCSPRSASCWGGCLRPARGHATETDWKMSTLFGNEDPRCSGKSRRSIFDTRGFDCAIIANRVR